MNYNNSEFLASYGLSRQLPDSDRPEIVFSGRSNVGKSSLINKLCNRKKLARVSATPGKTATINFYRVDTAYFVDLPGYGYAKVSNAERERWDDLINSYFEADRAVCLLVQLLDSRHAPSADDVQMLEYLHYHRIPFVAALTKGDKLKKSEMAARKEEFEKICAPYGCQGVVLTSAENGLGMDELRALLEASMTPETQHCPMAYNEFAYFYDEFNGEADYDALYGYITDELKAHGITDGILADLGCGTGDLTLMLTQAGYDVIGIDRSEEMLSVLREKADELGLTGRLLLLKQDLLDLDLYGTIRAAVSTFDTYSHIGPQENFEKAIRKAAYFMERGGVFIFDLNTPYKHRHILAGQTFDIEAEDADCHWSNRYDETAQRVDITINIDYHETGEHFHEAFSEYSYALDTVCALLEKYGFAVAKVADGESFGPVRGDSPRWIITAVKQYTQEEKANGTES